MRKIVLATALVVTSTMASAASDWTQIAEGYNQKFYLDTSTLVWEAAYPRIWQKTN